MTKKLHIASLQASSCWFVSKTALNIALTAIWDVSLKDVHVLIPLSGLHVAVVCFKCTMLSNGMQHIVSATSFLSSNSYRTPNSIPPILETEKI